MKCGSTWSIVHLTVFLFILSLVITCCSGAAIYDPSSPYIKEEFREGQQSELEEKSELVTRLLGALIKMVPEERRQYLDTVQDPVVKKALLSKKGTSICHFKLCNLGRRRRR